VLKAKQHKIPIVVCESLHLEVSTHSHCSMDQQARDRKYTDDTDLKRRRGMDGTKPIESGVKAMALWSATESTASGAMGINLFDTNPIKKAKICQKNIDKKATTFLTTTA